MVGYMPSAEHNNLHGRQAYTRAYIRDICNVSRHILFGATILLVYLNIGKTTVGHEKVIKVNLFSPLGKLADRAIYFACVNFLLF